MCSRDHPRIRGEHRFFESIIIIFRGSPPHTRGTLADLVKENNKAGITPAYAGNTDVMTDEEILV